MIVLLGAVLVASWPGLTMGYARQMQAPGAAFQLALDTLKALRRSQLDAQGGESMTGLAAALQADPLMMQQVLEQLQQLDWVGLLNEDSPEKAPRYVLLVDMQTTRSAPLMSAMLLADQPGSEALHQQWRNWCLSDLLMTQR